MQDLIPYVGSSAMGRKASRQLARRRASLTAGVSMQTANIEAAAELQVVRSEAVTYVGRRGMQNVALLTKLEQSLALMVPMASGRLQAIADITALAVTEVVTDTLHRVR